MNLNQYKEIIEFTHKEIFDNFKGTEREFHSRGKEYGWNLKEPIEFYAYYADYDWVVLCWLFGRMIDLPKGFPMYCKDLKQMLDEVWKFRSDYPYPAFHPSYPKQANEHNALDDAKWHLALHRFIKGL